MRIMAIITSLLILTAVYVAAASRKPAEKPECVASGLYIEDPFQLVGKILADSCTDEPTTPELIEAVKWRMGHCHGNQAHCFRKVCRELSESPDPSQHTAF